jgi:hypothetical protein
MDAIFDDDIFDPQLPHLITPAITLEKLFILEKLVD